MWIMAHSWYLVLLQSFNLRRTDSMEKNEPALRPAANINVAAILEKANAIRQVRHHLFMVV